MLQARPRSGTAERHVYRDRLLEMLPDTPGHVVWLHAPLGYGKSILAAQWAESLELADWRVLWTAMLGANVKQTVAAALRLPQSAPWAVIHEELASEPTLLVIEDLQGPEELEPLLRGAHAGLTLLASRTQLQEPELLRLRTEGWLHELTAEQLAFTLTEATELGHGLKVPEAGTFWTETGGWPLLLHFALLTGEMGSGPLHVLLRRSISMRGWQEALFLAAAGMIERSAANEATYELVTAGFLQELQNYYRLHPLLAEHLLRHTAPDIQLALEAGIDRLQRMERVRACRRANHTTLLGRELDRLPLVAVGENCVEYLQLSREVPGTGAERKLRDAYAHMIIQPEPVHAEALKLALAEPTLDKAVLLEAQLLVAVVFSRAAFHNSAAELLDAAMAGLTAEPSVEQSRVQVARVLVEGYAGNFHEALAAAEAAHRLGRVLGTPEARAQALLARQNTTPFRYELTGDAEAEVHILAELASDSLLDHLRKSQVQFNLAVNLIFDLQDKRALEVARQCRETAEPFWRLWADVLIAYLTNDVGAFPQLYRLAGNWGINATTARVAALWLRVCRKSGDLVTPARIEGQLPADPFINLERALHRLAIGRDGEARELLEDARDGYPNREFRQHFHAASYLISGNESDLDALLELSVSPTKVVRYVLLPLESLPRNRPELASEYPMAEVLASGWTEAVELRRNEIPRLRVALLGEFKVNQLGHEVRLPMRQQQIITLLALGFGKERVAAEVWPESPAEKSGNNLNVQLHLLRRTLEPWGLVTYLSDGTLTHADVDARQLHLALERNDAKAVLELYRGDLTPGLDSAALAAERESLKRRSLQLLMAAAGSAQPAGALPLLNKVLELEPLHEEAVVLLTKNLIQLGRRNAARRRVNEFRDLLAAETGLRPSSELMALLDD